MKHRWLAMVALLSGVVCSALLAAGQAPKSDTRERNLRAYTELLRSDIRLQKVALITELMHFTEAEDKAFWPIYREYELDLSRLNDERLKLIETYANIFTTLTDAQADDLASKVLDREARRNALQQQYYKKLKTAVSARTAAKAVTIEREIELLVDLQVAAYLPVR